MTPSRSWEGYCQVYPKDQFGPPLFQSDYLLPLQIDKLSDWKKSRVGHRCYLRAVKNVEIDFEKRSVTRSFQIVVAGKEMKRKPDVMHIIWTLQVGFIGGERCARRIEVVGKV